MMPHERRTSARADTPLATGMLAIISRMKSPTVLLLALACALASSTAIAQCVPRVTSGWVRLSPVAKPMLAGFARIENPCRTPVAVIGVSSTAFGNVSLHETRVVSGISRMRAVPVLHVPANGAVALKPGGLHLMLMQPAGKPKPGDRVPVSLRLQDGRVLRSMFDVRPASALK